MIPHAAPGASSTAPHPLPADSFVRLERLAEFTTNLAAIARQIDELLCPSDETCRAIASSLNASFGAALDTIVAHMRRAVEVPQ